MPNYPKTLRGAFIEYGLSVPPLFVVFQFNPEELSRSRSLTFRSPTQQRQCPAQDEAGNVQGVASREQSETLREFHQRDVPSTTDKMPLEYIRTEQRVTVDEESVSFDIRLDATDDLNAGNAIATQFGLAPQLATLDLMTLPKEESLLGGAVDALLGLGEGGFSFTKRDNPPMILFIWGRKRVLPVNINSMSVTETEFSTDLNPIRATVSVSLTVVEGPNVPYTYSKLMTETMSVLNLANIADVANVIVPG